MIAVTGANGQLGQLVIQHLMTMTEASNIVALVRAPETAKTLTDSGIQVRTADYDKQETLTSALAGVETLLLISSSAVGVRVPQHKAVIYAAKAQGVKHFVYTSILQAPNNPMVLAEEHKVTERLLVESGLNTIILRNGWYTENYTQSMAVILEHKAVTGVSVEGKIHSATRNDYAEAAAKVLVAPQQHLGQAYELAGDQGFTLTEFANEISKQTGSEVNYHAMSPADYTNLLANAGLPEGFASALADSDVQTEQGWLEDNSKTLSKLLGRPTTSMADSVKAVL